MRRVAASAVLAGKRGRRGHPSRPPKLPIPRDAGYENSEVHAEAARLPRASPERRQPRRRASDAAPGAGAARRDGRRAGRRRRGRAPRVGQGRLRRRAVERRAPGARLPHRRARRRARRARDRPRGSEGGGRRLARPHRDRRAARAARGRRHGRHVASFVSRGDVVVVKPNIGWDRMPIHAANTNPDVVAAVIKLAFEAGAKKVVVADGSCNDPNRCFQRSGIWRAAYDVGAEVVLPAGAPLPHDAPEGRRARRVADLHDARRRRQGHQRPHRQAPQPRQVHGGDEELVRRAGRAAEIACTRTSTRRSPTWRPSCGRRSSSSTPGAC